jgi:plasmid stabilization system protein ParE
MARRVVWSYEATADLNALAEYIAKDSLYYAAALVRELRAASRSLNKFSERGRILPELNDARILPGKNLVLLHERNTKRSMV